MKFTILHIILWGMIFSYSCNRKDDPEPDAPAIDYHAFASVNELHQTFRQLAALNDSLERISRIDVLWDSLKTNHEIPFAIGDSVLFLYRGSAQQLSWAGDFNGWNPNAGAYVGVRYGNTNVFFLKKTFPSDARLDYKIVANGSWILDPANPFRQQSGFGPNSELRMPDWVFPAETVLAEGIVRGNMGDNMLITSNSQNLNYTIQYRVYTPHNYAEMSDLPVIYVTDGHEYADDRMGAMVVVLDNLIHQGRIEAVIAVFVDPRDPANLSQNRRMDEYRANMKFVNFLADELVPLIDENYRTSTIATDRAILGTSLGGWNAAFTGIRRPDKFGLIGIHSPAFDDAIIQEYAIEERQALKIYLSTGLIFDTQVKAKQMHQTLVSKGYPLLYTEVNQGHSWGNWRGLLAEPLYFFFGSKGRME